MKHPLTALIILVLFFAAGWSAEAQYHRTCLSRPAMYDSINCATKSSSGWYDITCNGVYPVGMVKVRIWSTTIDTCVIKVRQVWKYNGSKTIDSLITIILPIVPERSLSYVAVDSTGLVPLKWIQGDSRYTASFLIPYVYRDFSINRVAGNKPSIWRYDLTVVQ